MIVVFNISATALDYNFILFDPTWLRQPFQRSSVLIARQLYLI